LSKLWYNILKAFSSGKAKAASAAFGAWRPSLRTLYHCPVLLAQNDGGLAACRILRIRTDVV
jgi:hypothetical protein